MPHTPNHGNVFLTTFARLLLGRRRFRLPLSHGSARHWATACAPRHSVLMRALFDRLCLNFTFRHKHLSLTTSMIVCSSGRGVPPTAHDDGSSPKRYRRSVGPRW